MGTTVVEPPPLSPTFNKRLIQVAACFSLQLPTIPCTWMLRREGRVVQGWSRRYLRATALCICICNCICICICVGIGVGISTCRQGHCLEGFCVCVPSPNLPEDPSIFIFLHLLLILKNNLFGNLLNINYCRRKSLGCCDAAAEKLRHVSPVTAVQR